MEYEANPRKDKYARNTNRMKYEFKRIAQESFNAIYIGVRCLKHIISISKRTKVPTGSYRRQLLF